MHPSTEEKGEGDGRVYVSTGDPTGHPDTTEDAKANGNTKKKPLSLGWIVNGEGKNEESDSDGLGEENLTETE